MQYLIQKQSGNDFADSVFVSVEIKKCLQFFVIFYRFCNHKYSPIIIFIVQMNYYK